MILRRILRICALFLLSFISKVENRQIQMSKALLDSKHIHSRSISIGYRSGGYPKFNTNEATFSHSAAGNNFPECGQRAVQHETRREKPTGRIIGGSLIPYGSYPWMVNVKLKYGKMAHHQCGGAIIGSNHVLTAAHCMVSNVASDYLVTVGDDDRNQLEEDEQTFQVQDFRIHPKFSPNAYPGDLAVLKLKSKNGRGIKGSSRVSAACLPSTDTDYKNGTWCTVAGWGTIDNDHPPSKSTRLRAASVPLISTDICREVSHAGHKLGPGMVCAGYLSGVVDACVGDSGGPLVCQQDGVYNLLGIVSWGDGCANPLKPGVYTNVQFYLDWIHKTMEKLADE